MGRRLDRLTQFAPHHIGMNDTTTKINGSDIRRALKAAGLPPDQAPMMTRTNTCWPLVAASQAEASVLAMRAAFPGHSVEHGYRADGLAWIAVSRLPIGPSSGGAEVKIKVELVVEVDPAAWQATYGVPATALRVQSYVLQQVQGSVAALGGYIASARVANRGL